MASVRNREYVYGSAAREFKAPERIRREEQERRLQKVKNRKKREKARHMNLGYVAFLMLAFVMVGYVLIGYVQMQAEITTLGEQQTRYEKQLNNQRISNEEEYNRILSNVDLEEIKRIAIGELGMVNPREGQVILYENAGYDFVRKVSVQE